jgi:aromatic ring-opening dioxygenase catalytic subunit (LigB family)
MTIFIVDIEAVDTRYTKQWKEYLPKQLRKATNEGVAVITGGKRLRQLRLVRFSTSVALTFTKVNN